jgi:hypothetical protein
VISDLLVVQVCSGCSQHRLDLNHWRSFLKVSRFAQTHSPINRTTDRRPCSGVGGREFDNALA